MTPAMANKKSAKGTPSLRTSLGSSSELRKRKLAPTHEATVSQAFAAAEGPPDGFGWTG
jgi:hypothetical protein